MDPDGNLQEQRAIVARISVSNSDDDISRLLSLMTSMDIWLAHGGFLPRDWQVGVNRGDRLSNLKRYSQQTFDSGIGTYEEFVEDPQGEWVKYVDVASPNVPPGHKSCTSAATPEEHYCTCLSISRDPYCHYHGDVDKVRSK